MKSAFGRTEWNLDVSLAGELPQEFLLVHAVLERFAAVDEDGGTAGRVYQSGVAGNTAAGFENDVVDKAAGRISVELGAKHPGRL